MSGRDVLRWVVLIFLLAGSGLALVLLRSSGSGPAAAVPVTDGGSIPATDSIGPVGPVFDDGALREIFSPVDEQITAGAFPGAAAAIGIGAEIHLIGKGAIGWTRNAPPADPDSTIYDLASVTKVVASGTAVMLLMDEGRLGLDDPVGRFLPEFNEGAKANVTVRQLLMHTSGLPEGATLVGTNRADRLMRARRFSIYPPAGARVQYSDVGYILLGEIIEVAAGERIDRYLERKLFDPLDMRSTSFSPGLDCERCAPTGRLRDQSLYRGLPFDPLAQRLDGISGHAGLFATARDLGRFMAMIANGGHLEGVRVLSEEAVRTFLATQGPNPGYRLSWEEACYRIPSGDPRRDRPICQSGEVIGHTGWTGAALHFDLHSGAWMVLLTNRTYEPRAVNQIVEVRRDVMDRMLISVDSWRASRGIR